MKRTQSDYEMTLESKESCKEDLEIALVKKDLEIGHLTHQIKEAAKQIKEATQRAEVEAVRTANSEIEKQSLKLQLLRTQRKADSQAERYFALQEAYTKLAGEKGYTVEDSKPAFEEIANYECTRDRDGLCKSVKNDEQSVVAKGGRKSNFCKCYHNLPEILCCIKYQK